MNLEPRTSTAERLTSNQLEMQVLIPEVGNINRIKVVGVAERTRSAEIGCAIVTVSDGEELR